MTQPREDAHWCGQLVSEYHTTGLRALLNILASVVAPGADHRQIGDVWSLADIRHSARVAIALGERMLGYSEDVLQHSEQRRQTLLDTRGILDA